MFKIGDKVKCINTSGSFYLELNQVYTINKIRNEYVYLNDDEDTAYYAHRFVKVKKHNRGIVKHFKIVYTSIDKNSLKKEFQILYGLKPIKQKESQQALRDFIKNKRMKIKHLQLTQKYYIHKKTGAMGLDIESCIQSVKDHRAILKDKNSRMLYSRVLDYKIKKFKESKIPKNNIPHFGIEIEGGINLELSNMMKLMISEIPDSYKYCQLTLDGSIHRVNGNSFELRVLLPMNNYKEKLKEIYSFLMKYGFNVNDSCGLHVHLDCSKKSSTEITDLYQKLVKAQNFLFKISSKSRRNNRFCRRSPENFSYDRYRAINAQAISSHKTIEVRLKNATTDITEIISYLMLLKRIYDTNVSFKEKERLTDKKIEKVFDLSSELWKELNDLKQKYAA